MLHKSSSASTKKGSELDIIDTDIFDKPSVPNHLDEALKVFYPEHVKEESVMTMKKKKKLSSTSTTCVVFFSSTKVFGISFGNFTHTLQQDQSEELLKNEKCSDSKQQQVLSQVDRQVLVI